MRVEQQDLVYRKFSSKGRFKLHAGHLAVGNGGRIQFLVERVVKRVRNSRKVETEGLKRQYEHLDR